MLEDFTTEGQTKEDLIRQLSSFLAATEKNRNILSTEAYQQYFTTYNKPELLSQIIGQIKQIQQQHPDMNSDIVKRPKQG